MLSHSRHKPPLFSFTIMLRRITTITRHRNHRLHRHLPYFSRQFTSTNHSTTPTTPPHAAPPPPPPSSLPVLHRLKPSSLSSFNRSYKYALTASAAGILTACSAYVILRNDDVVNDQSVDRSKDKSLVYEAVDRSKESVRRVLHRMKQTGVAAAVLWKSLSSVLRNYEVRLGFEVRVAALLADIVAANEDRRAAIVGAGGGVVVDWLLESVGMNGGGGGEAARALAYLIADENVCGMVLGRPNAVPNLLRFIYFAQPSQSKKQPRRSSFDTSDPSKGRSMLVAAIMDIVTSNCDNVDRIKLKPMLSGTATMRDIAAALQVVEEGGMQMDEPPDIQDDDDGGTGLKGIGIKVLGGTTVVGFSRSNGSMLPLESFHLIN